MQRPSVRPSVCPIDQQQQRSAAGIPLSAPRAGCIDRQQATALSSKCGQCHVDRRRTRLNTDLLIVGRLIGCSGSGDRRDREHDDRRQQTPPTTGQWAGLSVRRAVKSALPPVESL